MAEYSVCAHVIILSLPRTYTHAHCSFDWFVPVEIEPGKYMFRISPVSHLGPDNANHRFSEKDQVSRLSSLLSPPLHLTPRSIALAHTAQRAEIAAACTPQLVTHMLCAWQMLRSRDSAFVTIS